MLHQDYYIGFLYKEVFIYLEKYRTTLTGSFFLSLGEQKLFLLLFSIDRKNGYEPNQVLAI